MTVDNSSCSGRGMGGVAGEMEAKGNGVNCRKNVSTAVNLCPGPSKNIICVRPELFLSLAVGTVTGPEGNEGTV